MYTSPMAKRKKTRKNSRHKPAVVGFRLPDELQPRLDEHVKELNETNPGGNWTRSSAAANVMAVFLKDRGKDAS